MADLSLQAVAAAGDGVAIGRIEHFDGGHLIHRQRSGFVGVDRRCEAQRLDGWQVLDDCFLLGKLNTAEREHHLDNHRKS